MSQLELNGSYPPCPIHNTVIGTLSDKYKLSLCISLVINMISITGTDSCCSCVLKKTGSQDPRSSGTFQKFIFSFILELRDPDPRNIDLIIFHVILYNSKLAYFSVCVDGVVSHTQVGETIYCHSPTQPNTKRSLAATFPQINEL